MGCSARSTYSYMYFSRMMKCTTSRDKDSYLLRGSISSSRFGKGVGGYLTVLSKANLPLSNCESGFFFFFSFFPFFFFYSLQGGQVCELGQRSRSLFSAGRSGTVKSTDSCQAVVILNISAKAMIIFSFDVRMGFGWGVGKLGKGAFCGRPT